MTRFARRLVLGVVGLLLTALPIPAVAQDDIRAEIKGILEDSAVRGAGIVIVEEGVPAVEVYWGIADVEAGRAVEADTVFRAGSVSKNVTSLIALRLIEDGRLDPLAEVSDLAPEILISNRWDQTAPVRVVHLLEHTAGLPGSTYREYATNKPDATPGEYLEAAGPLKTRWPPGTLYSYSNAGHTVLARVMERVTGRDFDALAREEVFQPLGMASASFATYGADPEALAKSYSSRGDEQPVWEMLIRPSGSLTVTPRDLARLVGLYATNGATGPDGYASPDALERMRGSEASSATQAGIGAGAYGFGTFAFIVEGHAYYGHWGRTEGFRTNLGYLPGTGKGFVIMLNVVDEGAASALRTAIGAYLAGDLPPAIDVNAAAFDPEAYRDRVGAYVLATHEQPLRAWLFKALDQRQISVSETGLVVEGKGQLAPPLVQFRPVQSGGFAAENVPLATSAFAEVEGRTYWIDGDAYVKVSGVEATFRRLIIPAALIVSIIALLHGLIWGGLGLFGRGPSGQGLWIRASLLVSGLGFLITVYLFVSYGLLGDRTKLSLVGQVSPVSLSMALTSLVAVIGGLAAMAFTARKLATERSLFLVYAVPASLILGAFAVLWIYVGWFPLMSWRW